MISRTHMREVQCRMNGERLWPSAGPSVLVGPVGPPGRSTQRAASAPRVLNGVRLLRRGARTGGCGRRRGRLSRDGWSCHGCRRRRRDGHRTALHDQLVSLGPRHHGAVGRREHHRPAPVDVVHDAPRSPLADARGLVPAVPEVKTEPLAAHRVVQPVGVRPVDAGALDHASGDTKGEREGHEAHEGQRKQPPRRRPRARASRGEGGSPRRGRAENDRDPAEIGRAHV